ncbi:MULTISPECIES: DsbA family protein [Pseudovibrio]|uniref:DsbA family protein n=1 Tax=Stappiaceae TaxID=2821832 RepID=UPI002365EEEB|nr:MULTISPECIES: DsbA family protein [Pseudovibrio]MDD7908476.1 DsbA family protein [Pseudovibrio exalbescens]MDX5592676.1 DsbA family protein [Pseudovibrio sp. SPO723]
MLKSTCRTLGLAFTALVAITTVSQAQETVETRSDVEKIIREYLIENPEIITEALTELEKRRVAAEQEAKKEAVASLSDIIFNSENQVVLGNPEGDVTLVEFFDYNCGYCKRAMSDMLRLIEEDSNLRVVLKEFPVLGQPSMEAAQVAIAVNDVAPEKYEDFHTSLLTQQSRASGDTAMQIALTLGISETDLTNSMESGVVQATFQEVFEIANQLGLSGTPSYVIGDEVVIGAVGYETLKEKIADARD